MGKFEFQTKSIPLDIAGNVYHTKAIFGIGQVFLEYDEKRKAIDSEKIDAFGKADKLKAAAKEAIDKILGDGSFDQIFAERIFELSDVTDIFNYITDEVKAYYAEQTNRAQRGAAQKG